MHYQLNSDASFCHVDDGLVFLDIRKDRYFRLPAHLEVALLRCLEGLPSSEAEVSRLVAMNVLVARTDPSGGEPEALLPLPTRSAIEQPHGFRLPRSSTVFAVMRVVFLTQLQLKTRSLRRTLQLLVAHRQRMCSAQSGAPSESSDEERLLAAADSFMQVRPLVPIEPICLLDAIAMVRFLADRSIYARLVFGVAGTPFAAHAWAQAGELALNDTIGRITAHTPIRVV
ncbi:lasso peptide biosynthesis B2 protein [Luteimonas sp. SDU101]|uniref:lasso peptide biosynthesis B2 protein n=1 Tax=Luteimonas sp. SDU101 TaxID=3422593 RepID=UPI003EB814A9